MNAATAGAGMAPIPITCLVPIGAMPSGRLAVSSAGPARSGRTPRGSPSLCSAPDPIPSKAQHLPRSCGSSAGLTRAEAVSARAIAIGALTYKSLASILAHNLDRAQCQPETAAVIDHPNLRGSRASIDGELSCSPIRTLDLSTPPRLVRHGQGYQELDANPEARSLECREGSACCSSTRSRAAARSASRPAPARPRLRHPRQRRGRRLLRAARARPRLLPEARGLRLDPHLAQPLDHRPMRGRQKLALLCAWPQSPPGGSVRPVLSGAAPVRSPGACSRRRALWQASAPTRPRQPARARRLGTGAAPSRAGARPPGDRRGPL